jgi:hypothetical protein
MSGEVLTYGDIEYANWLWLHTVCFGSERLRALSLSGLLDVSTDKSSLCRGGSFKVSPDEAVTVYARRPALRPPQGALREAKQALQLANRSGWIDVMDDGHAQFTGWLEVGGDVINEHDPRGRPARRRLDGRWPGLACGVLPGWRSRSCRPVGRAGRQRRGHRGLSPRSW